MMNKHEFELGIYDLVEKYREAEESCEPKFVPGESRISYAGRVYDQTELLAVINAALEFWLTDGKWTKTFETGLAKRVDHEYGLLVNSGSSANLLAIHALNTEGIREWPGKEVVTTALAFPTTVAPIIQAGLKPVFVDVRVEDGTYNVDPNALGEALGPQTAMVVLAHTLGNPFFIDAVLNAIDERFYLVADCCDALGSQYHGRDVAMYADVATFSFYPAHHITTGEGGGLCTSDKDIAKVARSLRDWGRDCECRLGQDNRCGHRFDGKAENLPSGYDHKYIYSHLGFNLKATELQAAIGCAQLDKLSSFVEARRKNWQTLRNGLADLQDRFILPNATPNSNPSWFGFALTCRPGISREKIVRYLESKKIQTRPIFAGNILRHPCFDGLVEGEDYRVVGDLTNTDRVLENSFFVGVYPGLTKPMLDYVIEQIHEAVKK